MACFSPLKAYRSTQKNENGKYPIVFNSKEGYEDQKLELPCGQCIGCRLERSRQWAIRCTHEASLYDDNCFITLTYNDDHLPNDRSLNKAHFQKFMTRLRKRFGKNIRYYHCGEYGEQYGRPHYHACIFNFDFKDKTLWKKSRENPLYVSETLNELWPYGYASIGSVTFQSAAYVARYIMKKITGDAANSHYERVDEDGVVTQLQPEYTTMSRRPGIGKPWLEKFQSDVYPDDFVVLNQAKMRPPRFYDYQFELSDPDTFGKIKQARVRAAKKHLDNNTPERLKVREQVQSAKLKQLKRTIE